MPGLFLRALHILIHLILTATCEVGLSSPLSADAAGTLNNGPSQEEALSVMWPLPYVYKSTQYLLLFRFYF